MTIGPGSLINGKYRLGRQLGEGGMGAIFEAHHELLGTEVALKFLHPALSSRPNVVARFIQEARVSANIRNPHVVGVVDVDQTPSGIAFLVMELLHGEPLSARLGREPQLPLPLACNITIQVLLALEAAHALGVVHRDMKPENVFLTDTSRGPTPTPGAATRDGLLVKILDFGIAKLRTLGEVKAQLTRPGMVIGTPEYMAPEQVFAADAVDARADLYAVGAMLFEMLSGRRPIQGIQGGEEPRAIAAAVMNGQIPRLDAVASDVPPSIADVVAIALSPRPQDRFSNAAAMWHAIVHAAAAAEIPVEVPATAHLRSRPPSSSASSRPAQPAQGSQPPVEAVHAQGTLPTGRSDPHASHPAPSNGPVGAPGGEGGGGQKRPGGGGAPVPVTREALGGVGLGFAPPALSGANSFAPHGQGRSEAGGALADQASGQAPVQAPGPSRFRSAAAKAPEALSHGGSNASGEPCWESGVHVQARDQAAIQAIAPVGGIELPRAATETIAQEPSPGAPSPTGTGTIAAEPSPYAPAYVQVVVPAPTAIAPFDPFPDGYGVPRGGTDAGFVPPYDLSARWESPHVSLDVGPRPGPVVTGEPFDPESVIGPGRGGGGRWLPIALIGVVVAAVLVVIVYAVAPGAFSSSAPAAPSWPPVATTAADEEPPPKKKVREPPPAESAPSTPPEAPPPTKPALGASGPSRPRPPGSARPPGGVPSTPKPPGSNSAPRPPDIIEIPLPWPMPND